MGRGNINDAVDVDQTALADDGADALEQNLLAGQIGGQFRRCLDLHDLQWAALDQVDLIVFVVGEIGGEFDIDRVMVRVLQGCHHFAHVLDESGMAEQLIERQHPA
ncbi:MAG: hypothetical protein BWY57_02473 [Betaproteobacteria bacterium ADurb.Bin341]|nr:MAG: hypothetical protein BWY57_02473 [Betaproteobacteria bacterium ADurb.Bin341]